MKDKEEREGKEAPSRSNLLIFFVSDCFLLRNVNIYIFSVIRGHHRRPCLFLSAFAEKADRHTRTCDRSEQRTYEDGGAEGGGCGGGSEGERERISFCSLCGGG